MQSETKALYGLGTAISMIVGVVIGSGIYFKADDILGYTGGNLWLGMVVILIGAMTIVFGSLALSELAHRTAAGGGVAAYYDNYLDSKWATAIAFYQATVYLPSFVVIVNWVAASYIDRLLGLQASLEGKITMTLLITLLMLVMNIYSRRISGWFQNTTAIIKVIPLIAIALIGMFWHKPYPSIPQGLQVPEMHSSSWGWLAAIVPLAFAFEGWNVVATIAPEMRNPRKNIPLAFVLGPAIIVAIYLSYFFGLSNILGTDYLLATGNNAVDYAANLIFGAYGANLLLGIVILSVLGVANGMLIGQIRTTQSLAQNKWIPSDRLAKVHPTYQVSIASVLVSGLLLFLWIGIHYLVTKWNLLPGSDISESTLLMNNLGLLPLFWIVLHLYRNKDIENPLIGLVSPIMATLGIGMLMVGSLIQNPVNTLVSLIGSIGICCLGMFLHTRLRK